MSKDTGGAAFPLQAYEQWGGDEIQGTPGLMLRDYFAAKALPGLIGAIMQDECHRWSSADFAHEAYLLADAMLLERSK